MLIENTILNHKTVKKRFFWPFTEKIVLLIDFNPEIKHKLIDTLTACRYICIIIFVHRFCELITETLIQLVLYS